MDIVKLVTDPAMIAATIAACAIFATIVTLAQPLLQTDNLGSRLKSVAARREELRRKNRAALEKTSLLRRQNTGAVADFVNKLKLESALKDDSLAMKLMQAGLRGSRPVTIFYFCRAILPVAFAGLSFLYLLVMGDRLNLSAQMKLIIVVGAAAIGFYAPGLYLSNIAAKRRASIMRAFPDTLDMLLICVESGMSIEMAIQRVGAEIAPASIELAEELSLTTAELSYLPDRRMAYDNFAKRTNHPGVKAVAMALTQAERYGTPLGQALRVMAKENREMRLQAAEKKAASLPAKLTVPMIVFFLPVLLAVVMGPAMIQVMEMMAK
jgi:tight adherence protein C